MEVLTNVIAGISFLVVPGSIFWLFFHRHKDWPKAWTMVLAAAAMGFSGVSRVFHAVQYAVDTPLVGEVVLILDIITATLAFAGAVFIPRAVILISRFPTPREIEHAIRGNLAKRAALQEAESARAEAETYRRHRAVLLGVLNMVPNLPPGLRAQIVELTTDLPQPLPEFQG